MDHEVIEKVIVAVAAATIGLAAGWLLERRKRHEGISLELGKLRAAAYAKVFSAITRTYIRAISYMGAFDSLTPEERDELDGRFAKEFDDLSRVLEEQYFFLDARLVDAIRQYMVLSRLAEQAAGPSGIPDRLARDIDDVTHSLRRYLPQLPYANESWWSLPFANINERYLRWRRIRRYRWKVVRGHDAEALRDPFLTWR